jgi:DNA repair protein RecN (Recombination protein N)
MLSTLDITNLSVIDQASLEFSPGMNVVTGETGAGKTLIVTSLGLLLGNRAEGGLVRSGADRALIEGSFAVKPDFMKPTLDELGAQLEDSDPPELLVARQVGANGRSRSVLGGVHVPGAAMADVVGELVAIHGQSGQVKLADTNRQRELLDRFCTQLPGEFYGPMHEYRAAYRERGELRRTLDDLQQTARERARELDLLAFGVSEIDAVNPETDEDQRLASEADRLQAVDDLRLLAQNASVLLSGAEDGDPDQPGALGLLGQSRKALEQLSDLDSSATYLSQRIVETLELANGLGAEVLDYLAHLEADPLRLETITSRRAELAGLTRKYGATINDVLAWRDEAIGRIAELQGSDERIQAIKERIDHLTEAVQFFGNILTHFRTDGARIFAERIQTELAALAMPHARVLFELAPLDEPGPWGAESVQLLFSANPGSQPAPLAKVASGGELSRVRLAIEVVIGGSSDNQTVVFDEVDAGVGGAVGLEIGRRLARLAAENQVIVVTHLAQVAAFADRHLVVTKSDDGQVTTSGVVPVTGEDRLAELARMMGGLDTAEALAHARALLEETSK